MRNHDPTAGYRQGNDVGTQYRSAIYCTTPGQLALAHETAEAFGKVLTADGKMTGVECLRMALGEPDASGRRRPVPVEGSETCSATCGASAVAIGAPGSGSGRAGGRRGSAT